MAISSVTSTMHTALSGIDRIGQRIEQIAGNVASGIESEAGESSQVIKSGIIDLPQLKHEAVANMKVFETAQSLLNPLLTQNRK
ncbi:hypothetical protein [Gimesia aquarii]|uniref:Uncharacterized protein n=1 Tax=Gimesia aquarii TaxID=2527964 RepID=A0A517W2J0_9PLAN|nr:hypothetical protein [Gimesia aquarii]QDT99468.1 hypothetical protein V144x_49790 [Gimesia aquarii]